MTYPETRYGEIIEEQFGHRIADPYRWLENDVRADAEVAAWVAAQNDATQAYLAELPSRDLFRQRLTSLYDHARTSPPFKKGGRYFFTRNSGLQNQAVLYVRETLDGPERALIDPNGWSQDGATALAEWAVSDNGMRVAYAVQEGGTDWRTIRVLDVDTGDVLEDEVQWARFTNIAWAKDGSGIFYARYPEPAAGGAFQAGVTGHAIYFHTLGTPQSQDRLLFATPNRPDLLNLFDITPDGGYALLYSTPGTSTVDLSVVDLSSAEWTPRTLIDNFDEEWDVIGNVGKTLYIVTTQGAARRRIVTLDLADSDPTLTELVGEQEAILSNGWLRGGRLLAAYLVDARTEIRRFLLDGTPDGVVALPGIGSAGGFPGDPDDAESFFVFTSFDAPTTVYRYDVASNTRSVWAEPEVEADLDRIVVEQRFYTSRDGARVPIFIVQRKDVTAPAPTLLYAYGGFGISLTPYYSPAQIAWIEQGGVLAVANLRGGGEYGKAWHEAGQREQKQNVFDDFIAAAEYLKASGITAPNGLAIQGESNGGLLVGAVVNQRPELFAAALPGVGVMDMLRFHRFTGGQLWAEEYGNPEREADFRNLLAYSPYHNIAAGQEYPAILATTADTDDRVVPGHTFKYAAALQAADIGARPHLVRIETRAGHGAGKPTDKIIAEVADLWAFAAHWTGLNVKPGG